MSNCKLILTLRS